MIDHGIAAFADAVAQAGCPVGIEGFSLQAMMMRGNLCERAA
jgi:hypothetical protein